MREFSLEIAPFVDKKYVQHLVGCLWSVFRQKLRAVLLNWQ